MPARKKACFFAYVSHPDILERVEFYAQDLRVLRDLGYQVVIATRPWQIAKADLYFAWWWGWAFCPVTAARLLGGPTVITGAFDWGFPGLSAARRALIRYGMAHAEASVFVSKLEMDEVTRIANVRAPHFVPHTVDSELYSPSGERRKDFILTVAGSGMNRNNSKRKCIEELIRSVPIVRRRFPQLRYVVAGEKGSDYPALARLAEETGAAEGLEFTGVVSRERKIELMRSCKLYLQPSRQEGFGLSVLEAMSCGAPVITSPVWSIPEVVGDTAVMADGTDPAAIAAATIGLVADEPRRRELGLRARARAEELFSYRRRLTELQAIFEQVGA